MPEALFVLSSSREAGPVLTNTTTATSLLPVGRKPTIPSQYFQNVGKALEVDVWGQISNAASAVLTLDLRVDDASPIVVWNGGPITLNAVAKVNVPWRLQGKLYCSVIGGGTTGKLRGLLEFQSEALVGSPLPTVGGNGRLLLPVGVPADGTGFDTELPHTVGLFGTWGAANAANSFQVQGGEIIGRF